MPFELTDLHTSADIGLVATGKNRFELFNDAAIGLTSIMVDIDGLMENRERPVSLRGENFEDLFFQWLSEIIFIKDAERFLMKRAEINFEKEGQAALQGRLFGDSIDPKRHILKTDVKAVTFYKFRVEKMGEIWKAEVVFDL
ncbi:MAG: archease [candidate division Zixibacteria bacterium]|jgi:SHS2 domain-containing protein|nr:archease [candidate division Zixibacteria bacterium]